MEFSVDRRRHHDYLPSPVQMPPTVEAMIEPPIHRLPMPSLLIGGKRLSDASGGEQYHIYAANGRATRSVTLAGSREIDLAVREAQAALPAWRGMAHRDRGRMVRAIGEAVLANADDLAAIQTVETATPIAFSADFPAVAASYFLYNAEWADKIGGEVIPVGARVFNYTISEPYGVVAAIVPWNAALIATSQVLAPILTVGNTVVLKPSPLAPFVALRLAELALEAGIPPGVINVVAGGAQAGEALIRHPGISKIHFCGSRETARHVMTAAADNIVPVCLELGGKSALLVFSDADLLMAAQHSMSAMAGLSGQGCALPTRVLIEKEACGRFLVLLKGLVRRLAVGDPMAAGTQMGPLISAEACRRVQAVIERAQHEQHGTLMTGGNRLDGDLADGFYLAPTIFTDVNPDSALVRDEIFGPVISIMTFEGDDDAVRKANATSYGLSAFIWTADLLRAQRASAAIEAGTIWINGMGILTPSMPFGGYKQSGFGRVGGRAGLREFTRLKNVWFPLGASKERAN